MPMDKFSGQKRAAAHLFPPIDPFDQRMLDVGDGHQIYVEQCGNPDGAPVIVLHGGPGGGCSPAMRRYFSPEDWRIILFDQRGCGRSRPHAGVRGNTTWHLVADIERIRHTLGIERWAVFGGSWGATLGLVYAETHPDHVAYLALRGVFLSMQRELDWFYGGGAGQFWPDQWARFVAMIPEEERGDLIKAYNKRLFSGDLMVETRYARAWASWENALASMESDGGGGDSPADYARAFARLENHYFLNKGFPGGRRPDPARRAPDRAYPRHHRAGPLRHDLPAEIGAYAGLRLVVGAASHDPAGGPCAVRGGDQRGTGARDEDRRPAAREVRVLRRA
jgi:proline iminopeptidase